MLLCCLFEIKLRKCHIQQTIENFHLRHCLACSQSPADVIVKGNCNKRAIWWINKDRKARNTNSNWNMIQGMWENWKIWLFKVHITMQIISLVSLLLSSIPLLLSLSHRVTFIAVNLTTIWHYLCAIFICCSFKSK